MLQFNCFFKYRRHFHWDQSARGGAAGQLLQAEAFLSETFCERNFRKRGQAAQVADAPAVEDFEQAGGGFFLVFFQTISCESSYKQNFRRQAAQLLGFFVCRNDGDAGKAASGEQGRIGIGSYSDVG